MGDSLCLLAVKADFSQSSIPARDQIVRTRLEDTGTTSLDLSDLDSLSQLPRELERLTSLRELNLSGCQQLSADLSPLAGLTSLQSLNLTACGQLNDLSPLAVLTVRGHLLEVRLLVLREEDTQPSLDREPME